MSAADLDHDIDEDKDLDEDQDDDTPETETGGGGDKDKDSGDVVVEVEDSGTESELEAKREARRQERHEYKVRKKEKDERLRRELSSERAARQELESRLAVIERKSSGSEMAQLDNTIHDTQKAYAYHKEQLSLASQQNNGAVAAEATERMMMAKQRIDDLNRVKIAYNQRQATPAPLDQRLVSHANAFMAKHTWYKANGADSDSVVMRSVDDALASEGWDPKTPDYWEELQVRMKKYLPHRTTGSTVGLNNTISRPKSIVSGSGRESAATGTAGTFKLSAARVQALKDAGMWNDSKKRAEMVQSFREYDRNAKNKE